jgi:hypothetical protein
MGVEVFWRDVHGHELGVALDECDHLAQTLYMAQQRRDGELPLLRTIDPYGDTRVYASQTDALITELQTARDQINDLDARVHLAKVIALARRAGAVAGSFIEFVGD